MKCKFCGGEIGLEERFCQYCGKPNDQAVQHHKDMASYQRRYAETEAVLVGKAKRYEQIVPRCLILVLLLTVTIVMGFVSSNAMFYPENARRKEAERNPEKHIAVLDGYLRDDDYLSFNSYFIYYDLRTYGTPFERYGGVQWCAQNYKDFVMQLEKTFYQCDRESWVKYSASYDIHRLCQALDYFMENYDRYLRDIEDPLYRAAVENMRENVKNMLIFYVGVEEEQVEAFIAMSENRQSAYVEEVLFGEK